LGTNCVPLFVDLFLYSYDADFIEEPHKKNEKKPSQFANFVHHVHTNELEINDTTDTVRYASYIDMHLKIDSEIWLRRQLYNKRDYICVFQFSQC
jgi:hypothetical protein